MNAISVETDYFEWYGYRLAYEVWGERGTLCLLTHGLLLDSLMNRDLARRFVGEGYRVILLDLLGHGRSDKPTDPREYRIDFLGNQVLACLDHLGVDKALVGGCSLGANTSLQVGAEAPERCLGLFLEMPVMEWSATFAGALFLPMLSATDYFGWLVRPFARGLRRLPRPRWETAASVMNAFSTEPEVINAVLHGCLVGPVVPPSRVRCGMRLPTLIIGHSRDPLHELRDARSLAEEMGGARLLEARSILELRTRPDRLWQGIRPFLRELRSPGRIAAPKEAGSANLR
jgi:pimeloyl-ACP methyl ester carboxylesterase